MVGKVWSDPEERYFWRSAVAHSSKRAGIDRVNIEKTWDQLAFDMQREMERQGKARRDYTSTMLFEHYFQNIEGGRTSPNAATYVNEYLKKLGTRREIANSRTNRSRRRAGIRTRTKSRVSSSPVSSATTSLQDKEDTTSTETASIPASIPISYPSSHLVSPRSPGKSPKQLSHSSRPLRRLAPASETVSTTKPSVDHHYENTSHVNQKSASQGWDTSQLMSYASSLSQSQLSLGSRPISSGLTETAAWEYDSGKYYAPIQSSTPQHFQAQEVYHDEAVSRYQDYSESYQMGNRSVLGSSHALQFATFEPSNGSNTFSGNSTDHCWAPQQYYSYGYQAGYRSVPQSEPTSGFMQFQPPNAGQPPRGDPRDISGLAQRGPTSAPWASQCSTSPESSSLSTLAVSDPPPLSPSTSCDTDEESLFVGDDDNKDVDVERVEDDVEIEDVEAQGTAHVPAVQYGMGESANWNNESINYGDMYDNGYVPGANIGY